MAKLDQAITSIRGDVSNIDKKIDANQDSIIRHIDRKCEVLEEKLSKHDTEILEVKSIVQTHDNNFKELYDRILALELCQQN